jgi:HD superfamily phosphohydrolase
MRHPYYDIPELAALHAGGPLVRIPDRLSVPFTPRVRAVVDTPEFQRLAHISQLGLTTKVYPGATHTRFEHALGVFHNACRYLWQLGLDARFAASVDQHRAEVLLTAALLHDIGHWPFCHPIEDLQLPDLPAHEEFAAEFLNPQSELGQVLLTHWHVAPEEVLDVLQPQSDTGPLRLLRSILSGPIDIDKMDYLERDSWHCGVPYGRNFDRDRLIQSLVLNAAGDGLAISDKGKTAAELMVFARYVMFSEVYWHHAVRAATCLFARSFYELHNRLDLRAVFRLREADFVRELVRVGAGTPVAPLLDGLFGPQRRLHKRVLELTASQSTALYRRISGRPYVELVALMQRLTDALSRDLGRALEPCDVLIDAPPVHKEVEFRVDVFTAKTGRHQPLGEVSPVVAALARTQFDDSVKRVRVFATAEVAAILNPAVVERRLAEVA